MWRHQATEQTVIPWRVCEDKISGTTHRSKLQFKFGKCLLSFRSCLRLLSRTQELVYGKLRSLMWGFKFSRRRVWSSESSGMYLNVYIQLRTRQYIPEDSELQSLMWGFKFSRRRVWSSESSGMYLNVYIQLRTRQYIPEDSELESLMWGFKFSRRRVWSSESSGMYLNVDIQLRTRQYIPEYSELQSLSFTRMKSIMFFPGCDAV
jgi:hypothetical protein